MRRRELGRGVELGLERVAHAGDDHGLAPVHRRRRRSRSQDGINAFEKQYPWIHLHLALQPNPANDTFDPNLIAAIKGGNAPDVAIGFTPSYAGQYCSSGLWEDLTPFMQKDKMSISQFAPATLSYTKVAGKQCALPSLTDAYGLYYNKPCSRRRASRARRRR